MNAFLLGSILVTSKGAADLNVETNIHQWSTARFELRINGEKAAVIEKSDRFDLSPRLKRGKNEIEIAYRTNDGKISRLQPAILRILDAKLVIVKISASEDNPRGTVRRTVEVP